MKLTRKTKTITGLLSVAAVALITSHASAQVALPAGDLVLGFTEGSSSAVLVNIGPASYYIGLAPGSTVDVTTTQSLGNFAQDLSTTFGSTYTTDTLWSVVGSAPHNGTADGLAEGTYLATETTTSGAPSLFAEPSQNSTEAKNITNALYTSGGGLDSSSGVTDSSNSPGAGYIELDSVSNSWTGEGNWGNANLKLSTDASAGSQLDLYELIPASSGKGTLLGEFTLDGDTLDFTAAIPEPSVYGLMLGGLASLFLFRRFRRNSIQA